MSVRSRNLRRRRLWLPFCAAALLALALAAGAAKATTQPSKTVTVEVVATGHVLAVGEYDNSADHNGLIPLAGPIRRGDFLDFQVINHTSKTGVFSAFNKKTKPIAPGKVGHFDALALDRGIFPYKLALSGGVTLAGKLDIT
jgi:hypothetical protein